MRTYIFIISLLCSPMLNHAQNALNFDGVDDRVTCGNSAQVQIAGNTITLEAWIYPTAWKPAVFEGNIINKENNNPDVGYMLRAGGTGQLNINIGNGNWNELTSAPNTLTLNTWQHVAGSYDGSMFRLYVNGIQVDSLAANTLVGGASVQNLTIGNWSNPSDRSFAGSIDEVRVWNSTRSATQIANNMNTELCSFPPDLVAYYKFNEGTADGANGLITTAMDYTGNNSGTLTNFTLFGNSSNWTAGTIPISTQGTDSRTECNSYTWIDGNTYTSSDSTATHLLLGGAANGCDSLVTLDLTIVNVDTTVASSVVGSNIVLIANDSSVLYQWLDCDNNFVPIANEIQQSFTPMVNGNYAVLLSKIGCFDTSACYSVTSVSINELSSVGIVSIYPNPTNGAVFVKMSTVEENIEVRILDAVGREIDKFNYKAVEEFQFEVNADPGIYFVEIMTENDKAFFRILKD